MIGKGCHYGLGKGGMFPERAYPWDDEHLLDCSGFVSWVLERSRKNSSPRYLDFNGGWFETTAMFKDATEWNDYFAEVASRDARPGDLLLYGDRSLTDAKGNSVKRQGHVGIVSEVDDGPLKVVHCSRGNERKFGDAIAETGIQWWSLASGIVARCAWVES